MIWPLVLVWCWFLFVCQKVNFRVQSVVQSVWLYISRTEVQWWKWGVYWLSDIVRYFVSVWLSSLIKLWRFLVVFECCLSILVFENDTVNLSWILLYSFSKHWPIFGGHFQLWLGLCWKTFWNCCSKFLLAAFHSWTKNTKSPVSVMVLTVRIRVVWFDYIKYF